jgi:hypothetical protein
MNTMNLTEKKMKGIYLFSFFFVYNLFMSHINNYLSFVCALCMCVREDRDK